MAESIEQPSSEYYFGHFREAFIHTWVKFVGDDARTEIISFLTHDMTAIVMYQAFTAENIIQLRDQIFHHSHVRDFVLGIAASFYARISKTGTEWNVLVERLVMAYGVDSAVDKVEPQLSYRATPEAIAARLPRIDDIRRYLESNRWLVILCMIDQCMSLADIFQLAPAPRARK